MAQMKCQHNLAILDVNGDPTTLFDEKGSIHLLPETFTKIDIPIFDVNGNPTGSIVIDDEGFAVLDTNGDFTTLIDDKGSIHRLPEEFKKITIPLLDINGNPAGSIVIDDDGISVLDTDNNPTTIINDLGSVHTLPEEFRTIIIPLQSGGNILMDENGFKVLDANGNLERLTKPNKRG